MLRKTILSRIVHREWSGNVIQHKKLKRTIKRRIDYGKWCSFCTRKWKAYRIPFRYRLKWWFLTDMLNSDTKNRFSIKLKIFDVKNAATASKTNRNTKSNKKFIKFWHEKLIFIKIVNFSTRKSLLWWIGYRKWSERDCYLTQTRIVMTNSSIKNQYGSKL